MAGKTAHLGVEVHSDTRAAQADLKGFSSKVAGMAAGITSAVTSFGISAVVEGASKAADIITGSIGKAASLQSAIAAVTQQYGESSAAMLQWSKDAAENLGLSQLDALRAAQTMAIYGKQVGKSGQELNDFSTDLIGMAGDLAAFRDLPVEQAVHAIGRAFAGERDPLDAFGITLTDASVKAGYFAATGETVNGTLNQQQLILGTVTALHAQMGDATGALAREQGQLGTETATTNAEWENFQASLGELFLPAAQAAQAALQEVVLPALTAVGDYLKDDFVPQLQGAAGTLADTFAPELDIAGKIADDTRGETNDLKDAIGNVVDKIVNSAPHWERFIGALGRLYGALRPIVGAFVEWYVFVQLFWANVLVPFVGFLYDRFIGVLDTVSTYLQAVADVTNAARDAFSNLWGQVENAWNWLKKLFSLSPPSWLGSAWDSIGGAFGLAAPAPGGGAPGTGGGATGRAGGTGPSYVYAPVFNVRTEVPLGVHAGDVGAAIVSALERWEARNGPAPIGRRLKAV